ncbi:MAG: hypothetical protein HPY44_09350 [Armatimonadetes bacterium]|nr:hypothetical protein [Armatimonadota bacterium]
MASKPPQLVGFTGGTSARLRVANREQDASVGECVSGWVLRALWQCGDTGMAALETPDAICIVREHGIAPEALISRPFADAEGAAISHFEPEYYQRLLDSKADELALQVQAQGEVSFAAVADLLPPVLDDTFLGDDRAFERPIVRPDGAIEGHFEAAFPFDPANPSFHYRHGLLGGSMNAVCYAFADDQTGRRVEMIAFGLADDASGKLAVYRRVIESLDVGECQVCHRSCDGCQEIGADFYAALLTAWRRHQDYLCRGAQFRVPEAAVEEGVHASLRLADLTFRGILPRYGVGQYDQPMHDSFPPATIFLAWVNLEWGRLERARDVLAHYLSRRVNDDGSFDYYGPAVAEYGQVLALAARYARLSHDRVWFEAHLPILRRIISRLRGLREESMRRNANDPLRCGMIPGLPEADYHNVEGEWSKVYYAGDVWVCRGIREMGCAMGDLEPSGNPEADALLAEATCYERDIRRAVAAAMKQTPGFVPPGADVVRAFDRLTESNHASYCNYRYLLEMVSGGILEKRAVRTVVEYRRSHGGELLGTTRFGESLDDWPAWHYCRGLLDLDDVDGYLMSFYGHLAHHHSRGNWASYEGIQIDPNRTVPAGAEPGGRVHRAHARGQEQVVPCQAMAPLMLKCMLVDEEWDRDVLHILRACPEAWLADREGVVARNVPTRWCPVSLKARTDASGSFTVSISLGRTGRVPGQMRVRLPRSLGKGPQITVNHDCWKLEASGVIVLRHPGTEKHVIVAR